MLVRAGMLKCLITNTAVVIVGAYEIGGDRVLRIAHLLAKPKWTKDRWSPLAKLAVDPVPDDGGTLWATLSDSSPLLAGVHAVHMASTCDA